MKKRLKKDYHELNAIIHVSSVQYKQMSEEEKRNYNQALTLLLGNDFDIQLLDEINRKVIASFSLHDGIATVSIDDVISEEDTTGASV